MKIRSVIVEDEILGQEALSGILNLYCEDKIEIVGISGDVDSSVALIEQTRPQLIFMDIKLGMNDSGAFEILDKLRYQGFKLIFTTSSKQPVNILSALNKFGAQKYLLKPLDVSEVVDAVDNVYDEIGISEIHHEVDEVKELLNQIKSKSAHGRLTLPVKNGFQYIYFHEIVMLRSNVNSTLVFMLNDEVHNSSKNLKYFETNLPPEKFMRVSKSFIVNLEHIERFCTEDGGTIYLKNECTAALSGRYSKEFFSKIAAPK